MFLSCGNISLLFSNNVGCNSHGNLLEEIGVAEFFNLCLFVVILKLKLPSPSPQGGSGTEGNFWVLKQFYPTLPYVCDPVLK